MPARHVEHKLFDTKVSGDTIIGVAYYSLHTGSRIEPAWSDASLCTGWPVLSATISVVVRLTAPCYS